MNPRIIRLDLRIKLHVFWQFSVARQAIRVEPISCTVDVFKDVVTIDDKYEVDTHGTAYKKNSKKYRKICTSGRLFYILWIENFINKTKKGRNVQNLTIGLGKDCFLYSVH